MTLTLTPELKQAIEEQAEEEGTSPEHLALRELNRAFLDETHPLFEKKIPISAEWIDLIHRRYCLIEKEFTVGLTVVEKQLLKELDAEVDAEEIEYNRKKGLWSLP